MTFDCNVDSPRSPSFATAPGSALCPQCGKIVGLYPGEFSGGKRVFLLHAHPTDGICKGTYAEVPNSPDQRPAANTP